MIDFMLCIMYSELLKDNFEMEWIERIRSIIDYIENHLTDDITIKDIEKTVFLCPDYIHRLFSYITNYGISEYIRNRRLHRAALDLINTDEKIKKIALKYHYENYESFAKAFTRFHGKSPSEIRNGAHFREFYPIVVSAYMQGGDKKRFKIKKQNPMRFIGIEIEMPINENAILVSEFWDRFHELRATAEKKNPEERNHSETAVIDNMIGEFGICITDNEKGTIRYSIAGRYNGGEVPEGLALLELPECEWAVFNCIGPVPDTIKKVWQYINFEELLDSEQYTVIDDITMEWFDILNTDRNDPDYHWSIWLHTIEKRT